MVDNSNKAYVGYNVIKEKILKKENNRSKL